MIPGRKQQSDTADWHRALDAMRAKPGIADHARQLVAAEAAKVRSTLPLLGRRFAYGWSGGKDSLVLELVAEAAGVTDCVLVISELEYPAFLAWSTDNMPAGLTVEVRPWDLDWLASHLDMLFPADAGTAARWFSGVQHWGQRRYCKREAIDTLLIGRRKADGNHCGPQGVYRDKGGFIRYSPLVDWDNRMVLTVLAGYEIELPPCYSWPRGFRVGTGPWAARQWTGSIENGWAEVAEIDRSIVETAAEMIPSADRWLEVNG